MATSYTTVTASQLEYIRAERVVGGSNPPGATRPALAGKQWVRLEYTVALYRIGQGLTSFLPVANAVIDGDDITWTGGSATLVGASSMSYRCLDHVLMQEFPGANIWRESVVYRWEGKWEEEDAPTVNNDNADFGDGEGEEE